MKSLIGYQCDYCGMRVRQSKPRPPTDDEVAAYFYEHTLEDHPRRPATFSRHDFAPRTQQGYREVL